MANIITDEELDNPFTASVGEKAPDFTLINEKGKSWTLSKQKGQVTALLFYPKNETLVCTKQLCSVRDNWSKYLETKAVIVGVSPGLTEEHLSFSKRYQLPMPILADESSEVTKIYNHHWIFPTVLCRAVVVIDAKGFIRTRKVMLRSFRPSNNMIITAIHAARGDALHENYNSLVQKTKQKINV